jgi:hypothetical protein
MVKVSLLSFSIAGVIGQLAGVYAAAATNSSLTTVQQTFMQAQINMTSISGVQKW